MLSFLKEVTPESVKMLVGSKKDIQAGDNAELIEFCKTRRLGFILTSAKDNSNVEKCFLDMVGEIVQSNTISISLNV